MSARKTTGSLRALARDIWQLLDAAQKRECLSVLLISIYRCLLDAGRRRRHRSLLRRPCRSHRHRPQRRSRLAAARPSRSRLPTGFLVWLGVGFVALLSLANLANLLALFSIGRFAQRVGARMHSLLFEEYLHRDLALPCKQQRHGARDTRRPRRQPDRRRRHSERPDALRERREHGLDRRGGRRRRSARRLGRDRVAGL